MQANQKHAVPKDTWKLLLEFATTVNGEMSNYDADGLMFILCLIGERHAETGAWPVLIDEFVTWAKESKGVGSTFHVDDV